MAYNTPIASQVKNLQAFHTEEQNKFNDLMANKANKEAMEDKQSNVPREIYECVWNMWSYLKQMNTWITLLMRMFRTASQKFAKALSKVRDLDIEKESLNRFSDVQKREQEFHEKVVQDALKRVEKEMDRLRDDHNRFKVDAVHFSNGVLGKYVEDKIMTEVRKDLDQLKIQKASPSMATQTPPTTPSQEDTNSTDDTEEKDDDVETKYRSKKKSKKGDD
jgi:hypothetical protein